MGLGLGGDRRAGRGLVRRGHDVALLAPPGSRSTAEVIPLLESAHSDEIGETLYDVDHLARALEVITQAAARGRPFDLVHDHSGFALVAIANRIDVPVLHTVHGPFTPATRAFYRRHADKVWVSGLTHAQLSGAPDGLRCLGAIPNPISVSDWPLARDKEQYLRSSRSVRSQCGSGVGTTTARRRRRSPPVPRPDARWQQAVYQTSVSTATVIPKGRPYAVALVTE